MIKQITSTTMPGGAPVAVEIDMMINRLSSLALLGQQHRPCPWCIRG
jgi:hypothetical protein